MHRRITLRLIDNSLDRRFGDQHTCCWTSAEDHQRRASACKAHLTAYYLTQSAATAPKGCKQLECHRHTGLALKSPIIAILGLRMRQVSGPFPLDYVMSLHKLRGARPHAQHHYGPPKPNQAKRSLTTLDGEETISWAHLFGHELPLP